MITSKAYSSKLDELLKKNNYLDYGDREVIPNKEPVFNVDLNSRKIEIPGHFRNLATKGDHKAETIWFAVDRFFDGKDLWLKEWKMDLDGDGKEEKITVVWAVQFINALGEEGLHPIVWRNQTPIGSVDSSDKENYYGQDLDFYKENENATIALGWDIHYDLTKAAGKVTLSLRCYGVYQGDIVYNLSTEPVTAYIKDGLYIEERNNDYLMNPPKDNLTDLVAKITSLYENNTIALVNYETGVTNKPMIDNEPLVGNMNSSFLKNVDYNKLQNKPVINVDGVDYTVGVDEINVTKITVDSELNSTSENPVQNKKVFAQFNSVNTKITEIDDTIEMIRAELGNMSYVPVKITSFINSIKLLEKNHAYNGPCTFSWEIDGNLMTLQLINTKTGAEIPIDLSASGEKEIAIQNLTDDVTYKLIAKGAKSESVAESKIIFTYKIFYGVDIADPEEFNSDFLNKLTSSLQTDLSANFTTEANSDGYYIYYAAPKSYNVNGNSFWAGGFQRGFGDTPIQTIKHNGTDYDIWRTVNKQKDAVQIIVK